MSSLEETIESISATLLALDPGPLAELRRMEPGGTGTPIFWRLASQHRFPNDDLGSWKRIVRAMSLLTPSGNRSSDVRVHERARRLGTVLCDGGDPLWPAAGSAPTPVYSELRLARFLAMSGDQRGEALERMARLLARSRSPQSGVNCLEIARLLLRRDELDSLQDVARNYYSRLDRAAHHSKEEEGTA